MVTPRKIFVIDDDPISLYLTGNTIGKIYPQIEIINFSNPGTALQELKETAGQAKENLPDYILLDINLPEYDAWHFLDELHDLHELLLEKFILMSSTFETSDLENMIQSEFIVHFIEKPFTKEALEALLILAQKEDFIVPEKFEEYTNGEKDYQVNLLKLILTEIEHINKEIVLHTMKSRNDQVRQMTHRLKHPFRLLLADEHVKVLNEIEDCLKDEFRRPEMLIHIQSTRCTIQGLSKNINQLLDALC